MSLMGQQDFGACPQSQGVVLCLNPLPQGFVCCGRAGQTVDACSLFP